MNDIVTELRDRAYSGKAIDRLAERAADEIERLRSLIPEANDRLPAHWQAMHGQQPDTGE
jgi:hypothetical protein